MAYAGADAGGHADYSVRSALEAGGRWYHLAEGLATWRDDRKLLQAVEQALESGHGTALAEAVGPPAAEVPVSILHLPEPRVVEVSAELIAEQIRALGTEATEVRVATEVAAAPLLREVVKEVRVTTEIGSFEHTHTSSEVALPVEVLIEKPVVHTVDREVAKEVHVRVPVPVIEERVVTREVEKVVEKPVVQEVIKQVEVVREVPVVEYRDMPRAVDDMLRLAEARLQLKQLREDNRTLRAELDEHRNAARGSRPASAGMMPGMVPGMVPGIVPGTMQPPLQPAAYGCYNVGTYCQPRCMRCEMGTYGPFAMAPPPARKEVETREVFVERTVPVYIERPVLREVVKEVVREVRVPVVEQRVVVKEVERVVEKLVEREVAKPVEVVREVLKLVESRVEVPKPVEMKQVVATSTGEMRREEVVKVVEVVKEQVVVTKETVERPRVEVVQVPVQVPIVKIVQVERVHPDLYQRTAGGYKVWDGRKNDISHELFRGILDQWVDVHHGPDSEGARAARRRMDELDISALSIAKPRQSREAARAARAAHGAPAARGPASPPRARVHGVPSGVPPPVATGWGRWTESHKREIFGPVGDGRGQRHLPSSSLEPGKPSYTSGVTPTLIGPPDVEANPERGLWEVQRRQHQKGTGPHSFPARAGAYPTSQTRREEGHFFATRAQADATAGGHVRAAVGRSASAVHALATAEKAAAAPNHLGTAGYRYHTQKPGPFDWHLRESMEKYETSFGHAGKSVRT